MNAKKPHGDFMSQEWVEPQHEIRLVDGVWKPVVEWTPPSSSKRVGAKRPRSMREKLEWERQAKEEEEARKAEEGDEGEEVGEGAQEVEPDSASAEGAEEDPPESDES